MGETLMLDRRRLAFAAATVLATTALRLAPAFATAAKDEDAVADAVEALRKAMLSGDGKQLGALLADRLSYGHSSGKVQTKTEFIADATSGKSTWKSITLSDQTVQLAGLNAITRFTFTGQSESQGQTHDVKLGILMVWVKQGSHWRLLARQGYKV
jgi:Domain of unknown function (DUF4440)